MRNYFVSATSSKGSAAATLAVDYGWTRALTAIGFTILVTCILLRNTVISIASIWYGSNTYSYGFIVIPITALLVWRIKEALAVLQPRTSINGIYIFTLFAIVWLGGNLADVQVVQQFALIGLIEAIVWTFLGAEIVRCLGFPLLFFLFCVPAGEGLVPPLQRLTAAFTVNALRISGIPAVQDGLFLATPSGDWKIAEACSGIRYLISSLVVGVLVAGVAFRTWRRRILFVLLSVAVPILANAFRAYLIVVLAYISDNRIATGIDHVIYGWIFFSIVTGVLIGVALKWRHRENLEFQAESHAVRKTRSETSVRLRWCLPVLIGIVAVAASTSSFLWSAASEKLGSKAWVAPVGWIPAFDPDQDWTPALPSILLQSYSHQSLPVSLYVASSPRNGRGIELINSSNAVGTSGVWQVLTDDYRGANIAGKPATVAEYFLVSGRERRLMWVWYANGNDFAAEPAEVKWMQAKSRLLAHAGNTLLIAISTPVGVDPSAAVDRLTEFASQSALR